MKRINITVYGCADCPYAHFNEGSWDQDAGWDCTRVNSRIVDQGDHYDEDGEELPIVLSELMEEAHPEWCPLPE